MELPQPKEKPARRKKAPRENRERNATDSELLLNLGQSSTPSEAEPTAMEMALREAMERAKTKKVQEDKNRKTHTVSHEQEDILARTLENKAHTS
jgi:hypothetical protein